MLLAAQQEEIRAANATLPPRQREVLALRELEGLSYDEIAAQMGMNRNSVAQLISRARIALRDALRRTALASIAPATADCERALGLVAMRDDSELGADAWLDAHLTECETCAPARPRARTCPRVGLRAAADCVATCSPRWRRASCCCSRCWPRRRRTASSGPMP